MASLNPLLASIGLIIKDWGASQSLGAWNMMHRRRQFPVARIQNVRVYRSICPMVEDAAFVAPNCLVVGNVILGYNVSVMYHATIRNFSHLELTRVGDNTTIMDRVSFIGPTVVGNNSVVDVGATLEMCTVGNGCYIGPGSALCLGAIVEDGGVVAGGTVLEKDVIVKTGELWAGNPGRKIQDVAPEQRAELDNLVHDKVARGLKHAQSIKAHLTEQHTLDYDWLMKVCSEVEKRQKEVIPTPGSAYMPLEARRFLKPRVGIKTPERHAMPYPVSKSAPWVHRIAEWTGNA